MNTKSAIIIAIAIILGSFIIGFFQRYELVSGNSAVFLLDKSTGKVWSKFQSPNSGPTNWELSNP